MTRRPPRCSPPQGTRPRRLDHIFGLSAAEFVSGDKVEDETSFDRSSRTPAITSNWKRRTPIPPSSISAKTTGRSPSPEAAGRRQVVLRHEAGKQEILARRIGANELETIKVCRDYLEAQREYASEDRDNSGVLKYGTALRQQTRKDASTGMQSQAKLKAPWACCWRRRLLKLHTRKEERPPRSIPTTATSIAS